MTAPLRQSHPTSKTRTKKPTNRGGVLLDQNNATEVFKALQGFYGFGQGHIAEAVDISVSAVSEWLTGKRLVPFHRIPALAELYGVDQYDFLRPADDVEKAIKPAQKHLDDARKEAIRIARESLAAMDRYSQKPVQARLFEQGSAAKPGRHLQPVKS